MSDICLFTSSKLLIEHIIQSFPENSIHLCSYGKQKLDKSLALNSFPTILETSEKRAVELFIDSMPADSRCIIYGFGYIFSSKNIDHFIFPLINLHTGKIPENRGRSPLFWDIIEEQVSAYGTFHIIDEEIDQGRVIEEISTPILPEDNPKILADKLLKIAIDKGLFIKLIEISLTSILENSYSVGKGVYKAAFYPTDDFRSIDLAADYLYRLWRCYSIWGKIIINSTPYHEISLKHSGTALQIICRNGNCLYGKKLK